MPNERPSSFFDTAQFLPVPCNGDITAAGLPIRKVRHGVGISSSRNFPTYHQLAVTSPPNDMHTGRSL